MDDRGQLPATPRGTTLLAHGEFKAWDVGDEVDLGDAGTWRVTDIIVTNSAPFYYGVKVHSFTYEQNPVDALRIMLRMAGYRDDEIDEKVLEEARAYYDAFPVESLEWPEEING